MVLITDPEVGIAVSTLLAEGHPDCLQAVDEPVLGEVLLVVAALWDHFDTAPHRLAGSQEDLHGVHHARRPL